MSVFFSVVKFELNEFPLRCECVWRWLCVCCDADQQLQQKLDGLLDRLLDRLLDGGTEVLVSLLCCMILLSVSQFNREAFGE